ncbi:hypothetical protein ACFSTH_01195 [Paenibacillus yanchengensis]|uniref:ABC transporter permease n=1 Tax=Paenibacillus yanchengensis TaxID=2035833 RepID=A0ABW4YF19_9BACL
MMKKLLHLEWKKLSKPIIISHILSIILMVVLTCTLYKNYSLEYDLEAWQIVSEYFMLILPLIVVLPSCWLLYYERKDRFILLTVSRIPKRKYIFAKWFIVAGHSFSIMFLTMIIGVIVALYIKPPIISNLSLIDPVTGELISRIKAYHFFGKMFAEQPLLYGFMMSVWRGLLGIVLATMGFVLSLFSRNIFIILSGPFLYFLLENYIFEVLELQPFKFANSFEPAWDINDQYPITLLVAPIIAVLYTVVVYFYFVKIKKQAIYEM